MSTDGGSDARGGTPLDDGALEVARAAVERLPRRRDQALPALIAAQQALHWLPPAAIEHVAAHLRVPVSELYSVATGYSELRLEPPVPGQWRVCTGPGCRELGAGALLDAGGGRTTWVDCRFLCALAPVVEDEHERLHGRMTPERLSALLETHRVAAGTEAVE